ncbi:signal transduction histidine kinase [Chitinispirillum alkaliphilum]|nr:signal transduction histidine kinase [Chitinispirillum alkaliphilum]
MKARTDSSQGTTIALSTLKQKPLFCTIRSQPVDKSMQILDLVDDAIIITDKTGVISYTNKSAEALYEISAEKVCGKQITSVYPSEYRDQIKNTLLFMPKSGMSHPIRLRLGKKNGEKVFVELVISVYNKSDCGSCSLVLKSKDVTQAFETERALMMCKERFESLMKHTTEGFYVLDFPEPIPTDTPIDKQLDQIYSSVIVECNDAMARMYGFRSRENILGKSLEQMHGSRQNPENVAFIKKWIRRDYSIHAAVSSEKDREGNVVWFSNSVKGITDDGFLTGAWGSQVDITDVKRAEQKLREQTWRLESIIEGTHAGTWQWNVQNGEHLTNKIWAEILGYSLEELPPTISVWEKLLHPEDYVKAKNLLQRHFDGEDSYYKCESRMRHKDGHWVWVLDMGKVTSRTDDGSPLMMFGITTEISERKNAEVQMRRERDLLNSILDSLPGIFYLFDIKGRFIRWNRFFETVTGYTAVEIATSHPLDLFRGEDRSVVEQRIKRVFETGSASIEADMTTRQGNIMPYFFSGRRIELEGKPCLVGMGIDISTRKQYEDDLKKWQTLMEYVIKYDPSAIAVLDKNLIFRFVSDRFRRDYRLEDQKLTGKYHYEVFPDIPKKWREIHRKTLKGEVLGEEEDVFKRADGSIDWVRWESRPWYQYNGVVGGLILYTEVITERKLAQENLKSSLKEKDTLLQEVYHRTKNNMQLISSFLELQAASIENDNVSKIVHDSNVRIRTMALAHEKLYTSKSLSSINLADYIRDLVNLIVAVSNVSKKISIEYDLDQIETLIDIAIPCGLIIGELVSNSFKHAFSEQKQGNIRITMKRCSKDQICLIVKDNGTGLPKGFDLSKAATLGVQIVFQIVEHQLHGSADFESDGGLKWSVRFSDKLYERRV